MWASLGLAPLLVQTVIPWYMYIPMVFVWYKIQEPFELNDYPKIILVSLLLQFIVFKGNVYMRNLSLWFGLSYVLTFVFLIMFFGNFSGYKNKR